MFLLTWIGQCLAGLATYNQDRHDHHLPSIGVSTYLTSGHFWQATAENWESEFLQMAMYIVLTIFLYQKGSPESRDPDAQSEECDDDPSNHQGDPAAPWPVRRGGWIAWAYSHSLSFAFFALFAASMAVHLVKGAQIYNEERAWIGEPTQGIWEYARSSQFWFESFQNWQSEFMSIGVMVFLSVYLRQRWSPESKPVHTPHSSHE